MLKELQKSTDIQVLNQIAHDPYISPLLNKPLNQRTSGKIDLNFDPGFTNAQTA